MKTKNNYVLGSGRVEQELSAKTIAELYETILQKFAAL